MLETLTTYDQNGLSLYYATKKATYLDDKTYDGRRVAKTRPLILGETSDLKASKFTDKEFNLNPIALHLLKSLEKTNPKSLNFDPKIFTLENYLRLPFGPNKVPLYIFDDHNHALFAWFEAFIEGRIKKGATLYHFDDHTDGGRSKIPFERKWSLESITELAQTTAVNRFIHPARALGLVTRMNWYHFKRPGRQEDPGIRMKSIDLTDNNFPRKLDRAPKKSILDIDIDVFCKGGDLTKPTQTEILMLRRLMNQSGVITIALSPEWVVNEDLALTITKELISDNQTDLPPIDLTQKGHPGILTVLKNSFLTKL